MSYRENANRTTPTLEQLAERARTTRRIGKPPQMEKPVNGTALELAVGVHGDRGSFGILAALLWLPVLACLKASLGPKGMNDTGTTVLPIAILAALVATVAAISSSDSAGRRRISAIDDELAWATSQPFKIHGYGNWLSSDAPTITVTLRRAVDKALFADAARAISPDIETEALDATAFSIKVPARSETVNKRTYRFGDIELRKQLFEQLLLPLHSDVGVEHVTMS